MKEIDLQLKLEAARRPKKDINIKDFLLFYTTFYPFNTIFNRLFKVHLKQIIDFVYKEALISVFQPQNNLFELTAPTQVFKGLNQNFCSDF